MDIRDGLILMRLWSYIEGAKKAGEDAYSEEANPYIRGYLTAMKHVLEHFDMLKGLSQKVDELMEKEK